MRIVLTWSYDRYFDVDFVIQSPGWEGFMGFSEKR